MQSSLKQILTKDETGMNSNDEKLKIIGLTGGIGCGKSTVAEYMRDRGFIHIDADEIGRNLTVKGSSLIPVLNAVFGPEGEMGDSRTCILRDDMTLDRKALASLVFSDKVKKQRLDDIMFEKTISEIDYNIDKYRADNIPGAEAAKGILIDAPLLYEAGLDSRCDVVLLIVADVKTRIERVCRRDGITAQDVRNRINSQMSDEEKIRRADVIIDNSEGIDILYEQLDGFIENL